MDQHLNPCRKKVSFPLCGVGSNKMTPHHKKSYSFKNTHKLPKTKSPSDYLAFIDETEIQRTSVRQKSKQKERQNVQRQILRMLQENNRMLGLLTDIDYDIKRKREEVNTLLQSSYKQTEQVDDSIFQVKESPYLRKLKAIKAKLDSLDIKQSLVKHKN